MVESKIYIGLNDLSTNTQLFENEKYIRVLRNVCYSYKVPFSFQVQEGGYIYESGEYARETSLVLTLIDVDKTGSLEGMNESARDFQKVALGRSDGNFNHSALPDRFR